MSVHVRIEPWRIIARSRFVYICIHWQATNSVLLRQSGQPNLARSCRLPLYSVSFLATSKRRYPREENKFAFRPTSLVLERAVASVHLYEPPPPEIPREVRTKLVEPIIEATRSTSLKIRAWLWNRCESKRYHGCHKNLKVYVYCTFRWMYVYIFFLCHQCWIHVRKVYDL